MSTIALNCDELRAKLRKYRLEERDLKRNMKSDSIRLGLGEINSMISELENLTVKDVTGLATRIKRKKHASVDDMFRLNHAFLQSEENIRTFLMIPGAINIIIKELTGHDSEAQVNACEILCNLSLGDSVCCEKIALLAGSYLVTFLNSTDLRIKRTSLWVITNILLSGQKGFDILISQEVLGKLIGMYSKEDDIQFLEEIVITIDLILTNQSVVKNDDIALIRKWIMDERIRNKFHLKILFKILFTDEDCVLTEDEVRHLFKTILSSLKDVPDLFSYNNISELLYSIRILGNLVGKTLITPDLFISECSRLEISLSDIFNKIFNFDSEPITKELIWLVSNIINESEFYEDYLKKDDLLINLKIKRSFF